MPPTDQHTSGSVHAFQQSWTRPEGQRYHFKRGEPEHQVQFAFQNHWRVFCRILGDVTDGRALEVGAGRGSMGAFFADAGFETHLVDTAAQPLGVARANFSADGLTAAETVGDTLALPYADAVFDVVVSIGLLEHFANVRGPLSEQTRVLAPGGVFLGYVVPERPIDVQTLAVPVNMLLAAAHRAASTPSTPKAPLYRNSYRAIDYLNTLDDLGFPPESRGSFGMFPVPLVSHSYRFPFTPMGPRAEARLIALWRALLALNPADDPWTCPEGWGLAFLVWAKKP